MTPTRKKPVWKGLVVAGTVAGVLVLVGFVVARTRTATGTRHYTSARLLPLREWGFGTNARAQVPLTFPSLPGKPATLVSATASNIVIRNGTVPGRSMAVLSGGKTQITLNFPGAGNARANVAARQITVRTHQQLTILLGKGDRKVLAPGRRAKYGFFAVESCDGVEVR